MPCGPHRHRRTFALWWRRDGIDVASLRLLIGHSSLAVLQKVPGLGGGDHGESTQAALASGQPATQLPQKKKRAIPCRDSPFDSHVLVSRLLSRPPAQGRIPRQASEAAAQE